MSRLFGPVFQTSYVVPDLDPLVRHFTGKLGIGPFFLLPLPISLDWVEYRGRRTDHHDLFRQVAMAYSGDMMIEILVPGSTPSHYHEYLQRGGQGVHHLGTIATDYDAQLAAAKAAGLTVALEGSSPAVRFAYIDTDTAFPGTMLEITEIGEELTGMFGLIKAASVGWSGSDPVREF